MKPASIGLLGLVSAMVALVAWTFSRHSGFVPAVHVREVAPVLGLVAAAAYVHAVARVRAQRDSALDIDRSGRALFLGAVMLVVALLAWFVFAQSLPAIYTAVFGEVGQEALTVLRQVPADPSSDECAYRLEVRRASVDRALDVCVARTTWEAAKPGGTWPAEVRASLLGGEILGLRP